MLPSQNDSELVYRPNAISTPHSDPSASGADTNAYEYRSNRTQLTRQIGVWCASDLLRDDPSGSSINNGGPSSRLGSGASPASAFEATSPRPANSAHRRFRYPITRATAASPMIGLIAIALGTSLGHMILRREHHSIAPRKSAQGRPSGFHGRFVGLLRGLNSRSLLLEHGSIGEPAMARRFFRPQRLGQFLD